MKFSLIYLVSIISLVCAGPTQFFSADVNSVLRKVGQDAKSSSTSHNAVVILRDGNTKTFFDKKLPTGRVSITNAQNKETVVLRANALAKLQDNARHPQLEPLFKAPKANPPPAGDHPPFGGDLFDTPHAAVPPSGPAAPAAAGGAADGGKKGLSPKAKNILIGSGLVLGGAGAGAGVTAAVMNSNNQAQ